MHTHHNLKWMMKVAMQRRILLSSQQQTKSVARRNEAEQATNIRTASMTSGAQRIAQNALSHRDSNLSLLQ